MRPPATAGIFVFTLFIVFLIGFYKYDFIRIDSISWDCPRSREIHDTNGRNIENDKINNSPPYSTTQARISEGIFQDLDPKSV